jgi:hypothetical protein
MSSRTGRSDPWSLLHLSLQLPEKMPGGSTAEHIQVRVRRFSRRFRRRNSKILGRSLRKNESICERMNPQEWWELLVRGRSWNGKPLEHKIRCPSCGKTAVRVGSKFEIAGKNDEKAWKEIEGLLLLERTWSLNFQDAQPSRSTKRCWRTFSV